ncbi:MAG: hypothetical protein RLZZ546_1807 [Bacteroidota bacterium]
MFKINKFKRFTIITLKDFLMLILNILKIMIMNVTRMIIYDLNLEMIIYDLNVQNKQVQTLYYYNIKRLSYAYFEHFKNSDNECLGNLIV